MTLFPGHRFHHGGQREFLKSSTLFILGLGIVAGGVLLALMGARGR